MRKAWIVVAVITLAAAGFVAALIAEYGDAYGIDAREYPHDA